jgi:tRNA (cytidine/uridine-2'-O-)-methyltransferase
MLHVVLYQPEIPPNTGNIIRLAANTGAHLHLVHPLGFSLDEQRLRRAGLDYREFARIREYDSLGACLESAPIARLFALTTRARRRHDAPAFADGDGFLFGPETRGLPQAVLDTLPPDRLLRIPMRPESRSLNLSNAVAVMVFEAWRQLGYPGSVE